MRRFGLVGLLALLSVSALPDVKMTVYVQGTKAGVATLSQGLSKDGEKTVQLGILVGSGDNVVTVHSESIYDAKGYPYRMFQQRTTAGKRPDRRELIVTFDQKGAHVVLDTNGDRSTKDVPVPAGGSSRDPSEFWFIRDHPQVGATETAYKFNMDTLSWDSVTTTYKGVRPIDVDGKRAIAFVTQSEHGTAYLDADGIPLKLELSNGSMVRQWGKS